MKIIVSLKSLFWESSVYSFASIFTRFIQLFLVPFYTKVFTPADYGVIAVVTTVTFIVSTFVVLQLDSSVFRWYNETVDEDDRRITFSSWFWCQTVLSLIFTIVIFGYTIIFPITIASDETTVDISSYLTVAFATILFSGIENVILTLFRIQRKKWITLIVVIASASLTIILSLVFVLVLEFGVYGFYAAVLVASVLKCIVYLPFLSTWILPRSFSFQRLKEMLKYSLPFIPAGLALWVVMLIDRLFLAKYSGAAEVGMYHIANSIAGVTTILVVGFLQAWSPFAFSISNNFNAKKVYAAVFEVFLYAGCVVSLVVSFYSPEALRLLTAPPYYQAFDTVGLLCLSNLLLGVYQIVGIGLALHKKTMPIFYATAVAALLNIALNFALIPTYGRAGAAWATFLATLIIPVFLFILAQRHYFIPYRVIRVSFIFLITLLLIHLHTISYRHELLFLLAKSSIALLFIAGVVILIYGFGKTILYENKSVEPGN